MSPRMDNRFMFGNGWNIVLLDCCSVCHLILFPFSTLAFPCLDPSLFLLVCFCQRQLTWRRDVARRSLVPTALSSLSLTVLRRDRCMSFFNIMVFRSCWHCDTISAYRSNNAVRCGRPFGYHSRILKLLGISVMTFNLLQGNCTSHESD